MLRITRVSCATKGDLETRSYFFFHRQFAQSCWRYICPSLTLASTLSHEDCVSILRDQISNPFFMEIIILICWSIWLTRNSFIFNDITPDLYRCRAKLKNKIKWLKFRAMRQSNHSFSHLVGSFIIFLLPGQISCTCSSPSKIQ